MGGAEGTRRTGGFRSALRYHDYRWLVSGLAVSRVSGWTYNVALYAYVYEATGSPGWAAATSIGRFVPAMLFGSYGGVMAERFERRRLLIVLDAISAVVMFSLGIGVGLGIAPLFAIMIAAISSMIGTVYQPATSALTPQVLEEKDLAAANSLNSIVDNLSVIAGPAFGALIVGLSNASIALYINAGAFLVSAWISSRLRVRSRPSDVSEGGSAGVLRQVVVGFQTIVSSATATILIGASVAATFFYGTDTVLFVVVSEERLGIGANGYGLLMSGLGIGGILMAGFMNRLAARPKLAVIISVAMVAYTLPTLLLVWVEDPMVAVALQVVRGAGTLIVDVLAMTALQRSLPPTMVARVFGVFMTLLLAAVSLGALVTPGLIALIGLDGTLMAFSLGATAVVLAAFPLTRRLDRAMVQQLAAIEERVRILEHLGIFANANRAAVEQLAKLAVEEEVDAGSRIITEGDPADAFYVLLEGRVRVSTRDDTGGVEELATLAAGDFFGEVGLLESIPRTASVDATEPARLLRIPGSDFVDTLTRSAASPAFMETSRYRLRSADPSRAAKQQPPAGEPEDG